MMDSSTHDFSHEITVQGECIMYNPCLCLKLGTQTRHEIDMTKLNVNRFKQFVSNALNRKRDKIQLPGRDCGTWVSHIGYLEIEIYDFGVLFDYLWVNLNEKKWRKRLKSVVVTLDAWIAHPDKYKAIEVLYDEIDDFYYDDEHVYREYKYNYDSKIVFLHDSKIILNDSQ